MRIERNQKDRGSDILGGINTEGWTEEEIRNKNLRAPCGIIENSDLVSVLPASVRNSVQRVMKRAIPVWRDKVAKHGDEIGSLEWARAEAQRHHCPSCGKPLYRSAQQCRACKKSVADELDGVI